MNWDDARIFLAVARSGQILGASRTLHLNHATVARRIDALEDGIGSRLFIRRTNGTTLSAEGERFLPFAERIESEMLAAREAAGSNDIALTGTVRIGAPDGFGVGFLAPRLGPLTERHPDLKIELVPVSRAFSLSRREADIAVTLERPREGRLIARKLVDYTLGLYASQEYLRRQGEPKVLEELSKHRLIGYVEDLIFSSSLDFTEEIFRGWQTDLAIASALGQLAAVRAGLGIGILHTFLAAPEADLVHLLPSQVVKRNYWLVLHEDLRTTKRVALVAQFIATLVHENRHLFS